MLSPAVRRAPARGVRARFAAAAVPVLVALLAPAASAQGTNDARLDLYGSVERTRSFDVTRLNPRPIPDAATGRPCSFQTVSGAVGVEITNSLGCNVQNTRAPNPSPSAFATASAAGEQGRFLRAGAGISASGPVFEPGTGSGPAGVRTLSTVGRADLYDFLSVNVSGQSPGQLFLTLVVDYDGDLRLRQPLASGQSMFSRAFLGFLADGFGRQERGWSGWVRATEGTAPGFSAPPAFDVVGNARFEGGDSRTPNGIGGSDRRLNGRAFFDRIPVSAGSRFPLQLSLVAETMFETTDPSNDDVFNATEVDFTSTARIAAIFVTDADGNDLTDRAQYTFDSGAAYEVGSANVVPEPGTWALVAAGLSGLGALARRRRAVA